MVVSLIKDPDMRLGGADPIGILDLTNDTCRWPVRDPAGKIGGWAFCGHQVHRGRYCRKHANMAFRTATPKPNATPTP
jgi:hypothetical protein